MKYNFEYSHRRVGVEASKWDELPNDVPEEVVPLSVADMELLSPPQIIEALKATAEYGMYGYSWWGDRYFQAVQHWMKTRHNWDVQKEWLVQTNGVVQGLYAAVRAYTEPGDGVLLQTPVYYPFYRAVLKNNRKVIENPIRLSDGKYTIDFEDFEEKAKQAKLFILCNPHNPLGRVWTPDELTKMAEICLKFQVPIVSDDIHFDLIMPGYQHTVLAGLREDFAQNSITLNAPSKTFSLAALCLANAFIPNAELRQKFDDEVNVSGCYTYSIFGMRALETGYMECADWVDQVNQHIWNNYQIVKTFMAEHYPEVFIADLEGTYLCWIDCRSFGLSGTELAEYLKKKAYLYLDDGYIFGEAGDGFERINLACTEKVIRQSLKRFDDAMKELRK